MFGKRPIVTSYFTKPIRHLLFTAGTLALISMCWGCKTKIDSKENKQKIRGNRKILAHLKRTVVLICQGQACRAQPFTLRQKTRLALRVHR